MKGRTHLALSFLSLLVITRPLWPQLSWLAWVGVYAGVLVGSLAPDVDAPDSVIFHLRLLPRELRVLLSVLGYLLRYLVYFPLSLFFWTVFSRNYRHEHRGLLHTPMGVTLAALLVSGYAAIFSLLILHSLGPGLLLVTASFWAGCILHLMQDSCTPSGIAWGFPWHNRRLRGTIHTASHMDPRPIFYAIVLLGCLAFLYLLPDLAFPPLWLIAILLLVGAWFLFLYLARVTQGST
jgi:inner membrane protein